MAGTWIICNKCNRTTGNITITVRKSQQHCSVDALNNVIFKKKWLYCCDSGCRSWESRCRKSTRDHAIFRVCIVPLRRRAVWWPPRPANQLFKRAANASFNLLCLVLIFIGHPSYSNTAILKDGHEDPTCWIPFKIASEQSEINPITLLMISVPPKIYSHLGYLLTD